MNRQSWTCQQDEAICKLVSQYGLNDWTKIASKLKENYWITSRTGKQCRERWYNHLNPAVNKKPWNLEEESRLFQLHKVYGNRWKDISKCFVGRTDNDIKNHFYSTLRRSLRRLNKILGEKNSTSQMREIKPSVLSTIMNYIYEQDNALEQDLLTSLQDLPSLVFEFANFKPIKTNLKFTRIEDSREKIADIFELITRFNEEYEQKKMLRMQTKVQRKESRRDSLVQQPLSTEINTIPTKQLINSKNSSKTEIGEGAEEKKNLNCENELKSEVKMEQNLDDFLHYKHEEQPEVQVERQKNGHPSISLQDDEMALVDFHELEQPSYLSATDYNCPNLTVIGKHWQPRFWQYQSEIRQFVDEVLEMNYEQE